ncbi:MAG TPA: hypothetical protein VFG69_15255 [Nannocystaceae bacterium]|nr:hypothetical protein [Nannocystaceae bacterium]
MDGEAAVANDELDLELLELLGTTGTETRTPKVYAELVRAGLCVTFDAGGGFTWVGATPRGRRLVRRSRRP